MFGRAKSQAAAATPTSTARMTVMPDVFYGGKDPVVRYAKEEVVIGKPSVATPAVAAKKSVASPVPGAKSKKMMFIIAGSVLFVSAIGAISWYYITEPARLRASLQATAPVPSPSLSPEPTAPDVATPPTVEPSAPTSTVPVVVPPPALGDASIEFPPKLSTNSADVDADSMTDIEEEAVGTDSGIYDTDGDGYYDGLEVVNLYNPKGVAPQKLIDSGIVAEYINPTWQYRLYYPTGWIAAAVDPSANQVLFSASTGDYVEVRAFHKDADQPFTDWFATHNYGAQYSDLATFKNRFNIDGYRRLDDAAAYFMTDTEVFVVVYHPVSEFAPPFRQLVRMMEQSFRPTRAFADIPAQVVIPSEIATSTR